MADPERPIDEMLSGLPDMVRLDHGSTEGDDPENPDRVVALFGFSEKGFGFGEITIVQTPEGTFVDTEYMSVERVKRYLCALVDRAVSDRDQDPERHARYNRAMGRRCGPRCEVCHGRVPPKAGNEL